MTGCIIPLRRRPRPSRPRPSRSGPSRTPEALFPPAEDDPAPGVATRAIWYGCGLGAVLWALIAAVVWLSFF